MLHDFLKQSLIMAQIPFSTDEPLAQKSTFKVGSSAPLFVKPYTTEQFRSAIGGATAAELPFFVLGGGSNVVFPDSPLEAVVISTQNLSQITVIDKEDVDDDALSEDTVLVNCQCGTPMQTFVNFCTNHNLSGAQEFAGLPGTIGGAVYMNAGAYKSDMGYIVQKVRVLTPDFKVIVMANRELQFKYRSSFFQKHKDYICLEATLKLAHGDKDKIMEVNKERKERRLESQPLEYPSAGSVFRNPEGMFAGKLIEDLGFKGLTKGGAQISKKHANFIINIGNATAEDVKELIDFISDAVEDKYGVKLKVEQEFVNWE